MKIKEYYCIDCGHHEETENIPENCPLCDYPKLVIIVNFTCSCGYEREVSFSNIESFENYEYECLVCKAKKLGIKKRYGVDIAFWQAWRDEVWLSLPTGILPRYIPSLRQLEFHDAPEPKRVFIAGNRFGKSLAGSKEVTPLLLLKRKNVGLVASEMALADPELNYILEDLHYLATIGMFGLKEKSIEARLKKNYYMIKHGAKRNWSYIYYDSTSKKIALEGKEFDLIIPCEAANPQFKTNWLIQYMGPRLSSRKGVWAMLMTPCERGEFYVWLMKQKTRKDVFYKDEIHSLESPFSYPEFLYEMKDSMPEHYYDERFGGQWQSYGGLIMNEFRPEDNIIYDVNALPEDLRLFAGMDFGPVDPSVMILIGHSKSMDCYYVLNEIFIPRISIQEFALRCIKFLSELGLDFTSIPIYGDTAKEAYLNQFREAGFKNMHPAPKALLREFDYFKESIHYVNGLFKINRLFITAGNKDLLLGVNNYSWNAQTQQPKHEFSHGIDALRYGLFGDMFARGFTPQQVFDLYKRLSAAVVDDEHIEKVQEARNKHLEKISIDKARRKKDMKAKHKNWKTYHDGKRNWM